MNVNLDEFDSIYIFMYLEKVPFYVLLHQLSFQK